jgi:hypothetical protein
MRRGTVRDQGLSLEKEPCQLDAKEGPPLAQTAGLLTSRIFDRGLLEPRRLPRGTKSRRPLDVMRAVRSAIALRAPCHPGTVAQRSVMTLDVEC